MVKVAASHGDTGWTWRIRQHILCPEVKSLSELPREDPTTRLFLRHMLATLAYRTAKTVRGTPAIFAQFKLSADSNSPAGILAHMGDLMDWALSMAKGERAWQDSEPLDWESEIERFFTATRKLDDYLASGLPLGTDPGRIIQGGLADALTHTGQLAMLRRLSGHKMKGENYSRADIQIGQVGLAQTPADPKHEFD